MTSKTFREVSNYICASMIILAAISVNNSKVLYLFPILIIAAGVNLILCSYYKLIKITKRKILRYFIGFLGIYLVISGIGLGLYGVFILINHLM